MPVYSLKKPYVHKHGTISCGIVETTPLVFKDRLYRFEYVRGSTMNPWADHKSFCQLVDAQTGAVTTPFAWEHYLPCAYVDGGYVYVFACGGENWGNDTIHVFRSADLDAWEQCGSLTLPGWSIYNTGVCKMNDTYVLLMEIDKPVEEAGTHPFTFRFATSTDLCNWTLTPTECAFQRDRYAGAPSIYAFPGDAHYYVGYLEAYDKAPNIYGVEYRSCIARSTDLINWEYSPINPVIDFDEVLDKQIANPYIPPEQQKAIREALDINASDMEFCEFLGRTIIYYSWGNQHGTEFLAEASCEMGLHDFLRSFFEVL